MTINRHGLRCERCQVELTYDDPMHMGLCSSCVRGNERPINADLETLQDTMLDALAIVHSLTKSDTPIELRRAYEQALRIMLRRLSSQADRLLGGAITTFDRPSVYPSTHE